MLDINEKIQFSDQITRIEERTHEAYAGTNFGYGDKIRISIPSQDSYTLPCESYLYIEGTVMTTAGRPTTKTKLTSNAYAHLFSECRYSLNGVEIDHTRNVGYASSMKGLASFSHDDARSLDNAGWDFKYAPIVHADGSFTAEIPLRTLMGFFEDYNRILVNCKQELYLVRSSTDLNCIITEPPAAATATVAAGVLERAKITIVKLNWKMPFVQVSDPMRLQLLQHLKSDKPIEMAFRNWEMCELPLSPDTKTVNWQVRSTSHLERPRYVLLALQTNKNDVATEDAFTFDHCKMRNVQVILNGLSYPLEDLDLDFMKHKTTALFRMFTNFRKSYYGKDPAPLVSKKDFIKNLPMVVIDCSHQNEAVKSGTVDVRVKIEAEENFPANTTAFCLLLHDQIVDYTALTNRVRKHE